MLIFGRSATCASEVTIPISPYHLRVYRIDYGAVYFCGLCRPITQERVMLEMVKHGIIETDDHLVQLTRTLVSYSDRRYLP